MWTTDQQTIDTSTSIPLYPTRTSGNGYFGTVGGGYDWQFSTSWVAGIFADAQFGDIKGTIIGQPGTLVGDTSNKVNYAAGARLGYLVAPNVLSYVNAGYSHAVFSKADLVIYFGGNSPLFMPKLRFDGWFLGGGIENSLNLFGASIPGWFMKTEYRVARYDEETGNVGGFLTSSKPTVQTIATALVYRFN